MKISKKIHVKLSSLDKLLDHRQHEINKDSDDRFSLSMWSCFYFIPTNVIIGYETCIIIKNMFNNYLMSIKTCVARTNLLVIQKEIACVWKMLNTYLIYSHKHVFENISCT